MKKSILSLSIAVLVAAALSARADLVLSNSFGYADGALVTVSAGSPLGEWFTHSGTTGQVDVASGKVNVTQSESEDVSTVLTNATYPTPFSSGTLYASFVVNFSQLPSGSGTYFAHYRDTTSSNFRAKVFATTNGASGGKFRVGVANNVNTPVVITTDLDLGTDYKLVLRYNMDTTNSTLWINPNSPNSSVNRANASDATPTIGLHYFCLRQSLSSGVGMGAFTFDDLLIGTQFTNVATIGGAPTITGISDQSIPANTNTGPLAFTVDDVETPVASLVVSGTSTNTTLVPDNSANITFGGSGQNRTVMITPATGQQGVTLISMVVTDGDGFKATNSFLVTVGAPSISSIPNQATPANTPTAAIPFTVFDAETPGSLTVTKSSSNPTLVLDTKIVVSSGPGTNRTVTITPEANQAGLVTITLTVSDGTTSASTSFTLTVYPHLGLVLGDDFSYADGGIVTNSGYFWDRHSGAVTNDAVVAGGKLLLSNTNTEDIHAWLTNSPYTAGSGVILYSKFTINFSELPGGSGGGYFAHYKDTGTSNFRARVFAETNGAAPGLFRIGVANGGFTVAAAPRDLALNTTYVVVTRYNIGTATSTVWVNPTAESSPGATAVDAINAIDIWQYVFRQSSSDNMGTLLVDDLLIGTAFSDVLTPPAPETLHFQLIGGDLVLSWNNPLLALESAPVVAGPYATIPGTTSPYTNAVTGAQKYFRLHY